MCVTRGGTGILLDVSRYPLHHHLAGRLTCFKGQVRWPDLLSMYDLLAKSDRTEICFNIVPDSHGTALTTLTQR